MIIFEPSKDSGPSRFVYYGENGPSASQQAEQAEGARKAPDQKETPGTPDEVDAPIRAKAMALIDKAEQDLNRLVGQVTNQAAKKEHATYVADTMKRTKTEVNFAIRERSVREEELMPRLEEHLARTKTTLELRIETRKITESSPEMKKIYEQLEHDYDGPSRERLLLSIDKIFKEEKDPNTALRRAQAEMMKETVLERCGEKPAKSTDVIDFNARLGREQMIQALNLIGVNFDSLSFSADQLSKMEILGSIQYRFRGATYGEVGLLDAQGNVQKEGLERLFNHEKPNREIGPEEVASIRRRLGGRADLNLALQAKAQERYKDSGRLATVTIGDRSFDLNEITAESQKEYDRFAKQFDQNPPIERMDETAKQRELPTTLRALLDYRFDESNGADRRARNELPPQIKTRLEALGMQKPDALINNGRIRNIRFDYKGEQMELTVGKSPWEMGKDLGLFLHLKTEKGENIKTTEIKEVGNLSQELDAAKQYREENQANIDRIDREYFKTKNAEIYPEMSLINAKETYLGSIVGPRCSNERAPKPETIQALDKILPMILANADALGINQETPLIEALLKIYQSPRREEILSRDYSVFRAEMKSSNSPQYAGLEPGYYYYYEDREQDIRASRTETNPDFQARKEQLAKMKPGDKLAVEFEGKKYNFVLVSSLGSFDYRFKLEGHPNLPDQNISNIDLIRRTPEQQLQYLLGQTWNRAELETEKMLNGETKPGEEPKRMSIDQKFDKGSIVINPNFRKLPFNDVQRQLIENINQEQPIKLTMHTDKYGKIAFCEVDWNNQQQKTDYRLNSESGNYWQLRSLEIKSSRTNYPFYDIETADVTSHLKQLSATPST